MLLPLQSYHRTERRVCWSLYKGQRQTDERSQHLVVHMCHTCMQSDPPALTVPAAAAAAAMEAAVEGGSSSAVGFDPFVEEA